MPRPGRRWITTLCLVVIIVGLSACGPSEEERFARSAAAMEQVARTMGPSTRAAANPREIGSFRFDDVYRDGDRVYFQTGDDFGVDPYGYVWSPNEAPADYYRDGVAARFEHVQGPWYRWSESW
ncbi:hypothetical protein J5X84_37255 [Streptosporangiaceae bacterium NEAU-GS5]|nr:hypothetical protein [Streptosporangiaceae bacterium NEAU-GS5]